MIIRDQKALYIFILKSQSSLPRIEEDREPSELGVGIKFPNTGSKPDYMASEFFGLPTLTPMDSLLAMPKKCLQLGSRVGL